MNRMCKYQFKKQIEVVKTNITRMFLTIWLNLQKKILFYDKLSLAISLSSCSFLFFTNWSNKAVMHYDWIISYEILKHI